MLYLRLVLSPTTYLCFAGYYKNLVIKESAIKAIEDMKKRGEEDRSVLSQCHPLMHVVGRQASLSYKKVSDAFSKGDSYCWSGYYHGIMEGVISKIGIDALPQKLNDNFRIACRYEMDGSYQLLKFDMDTLKSIYSANIFESFIV